MKKTQWVHRTAVRPMFLNLNAENNGLPVLISNQQLTELQSKNLIDENDFLWLDHSFWTADKISPDDVEQLNYIRILENAGVTREEYLRARALNYEQQIQSYLSGGLYIQRPSIDTTATMVGKNGKDPEAEIQRILAKEGFGFASGDNELSGLSNRDVLNVLIVLEIPENCVSGMAGTPQLLFRDADTPLEVSTAYFADQQLTMVIPPEYIKNAYIVGAHDVIDIKNPEFNSDYIIEEGYYDLNVLKEYIKYEVETNYSPENVYKLYFLIEQYYITSNSYAGYNSLIKILEDKLQEVFDSDDFTAADGEAYGFIIDSHQMIYEFQRSPLEEVRDKLKYNSFNMSAEETEATLLALIEESKKSLQASKANRSPVDEMAIFEECLTYVDGGVYQKIINSPNYNKIYGELELKRSVLARLHQEVETYCDYFVDAYIKEDAADRSKALQGMRASENVSLLLNYAVRCDAYITQAFVQYIKENDISRLTLEECRVLIENIENHAKAANQSRSL